MAKPLTPQQEIDQLRALITEAHEVLQDLRYEKRKAAKLITDLLRDIQSTVDREMGQLSNHIQVANNEAAAQLNREVHDARLAIQQQLLLTEMILDRKTQTVTFTWPPGLFDDQAPLPHPEYLPKEKTQ